MGSVLKISFLCSFVCIYSSMHKKAEESSIQYSRRVGAAVWVSGGAGCFHRGGQGGASNQPGVAHKPSLFHYKNVVDFKLLDYFSA